MNFIEQLYLKNVVTIGNEKYYLNEEYNEMKTSLVSNILHDLLAWNWMKHIAQSY